MWINRIVKLLAKVPSECKRQFFLKNSVRFKRIIPVLSI